MKLAFYKGSTRFNPIEEAIRLCSHSEFCHVELLFSTGETFSSSGDSHGTRFTHQVLDGWHIVDIGQMDEDKIHKWCERNNNKPYDYLGLLAFEFGLKDWDAKTHFFCSFVCAAALQATEQVFTFMEPWKFSPGSLAVAAMAREEVLRQK